MRHASDSNSRLLVENLRTTKGVTAFYVKDSTSGAPDLVVGYKGRCHSLEIKRLGGRMRPTQVDFCRSWTGCYHVVTNSVEALMLIKECDGREDHR